jgi:hypothetical protein
MDFPIWAVWNMFSGKWLGMWVVPNNWCGATIAYLYLSLVYCYDGKIKSLSSYGVLPVLTLLTAMPLQTTTDCGSEITQVYGFANALRYVFLLHSTLVSPLTKLILREYFSPHLSTDELPAHHFMQSVNNITIECGWLHLCLQWGDNVKVFWEVGHEVYNDMDPHQS